MVCKYSNKRLCDNEKCVQCYKTLASYEKKKAIYWPDKNNPITPRIVCKI